MSDPTRIEMGSDALTRRFSGTTYHRSMEFDVPFITQIDENLYVGGCDEGLKLPEVISHLVSLYPWESYALSRNLKSMLFVRMYDSEEQGYEQVLDIARWVNSCRRDQPTLVHCQAGLNRSNLIVATALILDGMAPVEAIALLREKRSPAVLCNPAFESWLLKGVPFR